MEETRFLEKLEANSKRVLSSDVVSGQQNVMSEAKTSELGNGQPSYGLRENPRKSWRANGWTSPMHRERFCKQCGKGFQSLKALCGHMASHSEKGRGFRDDHSWSSESGKMVLDSYSDTEEGDFRRSTARSTRDKKCPKVEVKHDPMFSSANDGSSSLSEMDVPDLEEVALCLMLLSNDLRQKGAANSGVDSSDNNSVVVETKSSSIDTKVVRNKDDVKLENADINKPEDSDSMYFLVECTKAESNESVGKFLMNNGLPERKNFAKSRKVKRSSEEDRNFWKKTSKSGMTKNRPNDAETFCESQKRSKYECFNCKKSFKSYQALGGHRPCHKRSDAFYECESGENGVDYPVDSKACNSRKTSSKSPYESEQKGKVKKSKGHACPFCDKIFKNGQALGGHKRSHFIGGNVVNQDRGGRVKGTEIRSLLNLNLPAPEEDEEVG